MYEKAAYKEMWAKALNAVELETASFTLRTGDVRTTDDLNGFLGVFDQPKPARRKLKPNSQTTVTLAELDARLRRGKAALGLRDLLEVITGKPVLSRGERRDIFAAEATEAGLDGWPWLETWLDYCQSPRRVDPTSVHRLAKQCVEVLSRLELDPRRLPVEHRPLRGFAESFTEGSNGLGPRSAVGQLVMRALALAHDRPVPVAAYDRWLLWLRVGVIMDEKSTWDVFISHAHEDKGDFVRPLADALARAGLRVWYDEYTVLPGDSILDSINRGVQRSQAGLLVMSHHSVEKYWTKLERDALHSIASVQGTRLIPILHGMTGREFTSLVPVLATRLAISSGIGVPAVVDRVLHAVSGIPFRPSA